MTLEFDLMDLSSDSGPSLTDASAPESQACPSTTSTTTLSTSPRPSTGENQATSPTFPLANRTGRASGAPRNFHGLVKACPGARWNFTGTPSSEAMHYHILRKKHDKRYFSITTPEAPNPSWSPLPSHREMETRPCFQTGSRIHLLTCGHTVAVPRNAEPCATNCAHHLTTLASGTALPARHASALRKSRDAIIDAVNAHERTQALTNPATAEATAIIHAAANAAIWADQNAQLVPKLDLIGGNFACALCAETDARGEGLRRSDPAMFMPQKQYACILVGRDEQDRQVIGQLVKGVRPWGLNQVAEYVSKQDPAGGLRGAATGTGPRVGVRRERESGRQRKARLRDGWRSAVRRKEKDAVMGRLREETLVEGLEMTGL